MDEVCRTISIIDTDTGSVKCVVDQVVQPNHGPAPYEFLELFPAAFAKEGKVIFLEEPKHEGLCLYDPATKRRTPLILVSSKQLWPGFLISHNREVIIRTDGDSVIASNAESGKDLRRIVIGMGTDFIPRGLSPDGEFVAIDGPSQIEVWKASNGTKVMTDNSQVMLGFTPTGHTLVSFLKDRIHFFDLDKKRSRDLPTDPGYYWAVFCDDGSRLAAKNNAEVMLIDGLSGQTMDRLRSEGVGAIAISPDGNLIAFGDDSGELRLWNPNSGRPPRRIPIPGRTGAYTWPLPFAALLAWTGICYCIWLRRRKNEKLALLP